MTVTPARAGAPLSRVTLPALALATALFHVLTATSTGYFRDELYYLACAARLDWGYVDHPPLVALTGALVRGTLGESTLAIRILPAAAVGATVYLAGRLARVLGGRSFAQVLAALVTAVAPVVLALASFFSMNAFDLLIWAALWLLAARILTVAENDRLWVCFGALAGVGLMNKISVLFLLGGLAAGVLATGRWAMLRSPRLWIGVALAAILFLPHVLWQIAHGWPTLEFMENARRLKMAQLPPLAFLVQVVLMAGPISALVWLPGAGALLGAPRLRAARALGVAFVAILLVLLVTRSKPYYLAPALIAPFAAGAVVTDAWLSRRRPTSRRVLRAALVVVVVAGGAIAAPIARPLLSPETSVGWADRTGLSPASEERHAMGALPQLHADRFGWRELALAVAEVRATLPPETRVHVYAENYGQAGAIDRFGPALGLPHAVSGHNSYYLWGPGEVGPDDTWIVIGSPREEVVRVFTDVELATTFQCAWCMPYESGKPIWIARGLRAPIDEVWPRLKSFI